MTIKKNGQGCISTFIFCFNESVHAAISNQRHRTVILKDFFEVFVGITYKIKGIR